MKANEKIFKISSDFCLKLLFSYLDYNSILKIIKNSKKLQKRLCLNISNYKNKLSYKYAEKKIVKKMYFNNNDKRITIKIILIYLLISNFIYFYIFSFMISFYYKGPSKDTKNNTTLSYLFIIDNLLNSLAGYYISIVISIILFYFWISKDYHKDKRNVEIFKIIAMIIICFINLSYLIIFIIILIYSYKIKMGGTPWYIICGYFSIIFTFLYTLLNIYLLYLFISEIKKYKKTYSEIVLKKFKDIKIDEFRLPDNFKNFNKEEKIKYIYNNKNKYKYSMDFNQDF